MGIIYKISNSINNKTYIGQTNCSISKRWAEHKSNALSSNINSIMYKSIRKHGVENFTIEEIDGANSQDELNYKEWLYIHKFNSLAPNGYNLKEGGKNARMSEESKLKISKANKGQRMGRTAWNKGKTLTPEHIEKTRAANLGRVPWNKGLKIPEHRIHKHTEEDCKKMSIAMEGKNNHRFGTVTSEETKIKIRAALSGEKCYNSKKVISDQGEIFTSAVEASVSMGKHKQSVTVSIRQKTRCNGRYWKYIND